MSKLANRVITIDGPAASGKTSVSAGLANRIKWSWVSTGAFYRGLAYVVLQNQIPLSNETEIAKLCFSPEWKVQMGEKLTHVFYQGIDVSSFISQEKVGSVASQISHYPSVRRALLDAQRKCAENTEGGLIAEGRDCGTVVFPNANLKIYLTARSEDRAQRRAQEQGANISETLEQQKIRDQQDRERAAAPLQIPENAVVFDTSSLNLLQVLDRIEDLARTTLNI